MTPLARDASDNSRSLRAYCISNRAASILIPLVVRIFYWAWVVKSRFVGIICFYVPTHCSQVLAGKPNYNRTVDFNPSHHVRPLGIIAMELMEGESDEERVVGIKNLRRWPSDSDAVDFLSTTTSAGSLRELQKVKVSVPIFEDYAYPSQHQLLLEQRWNRGELVWLFLYTLKKSWNNCSLGN